MIRTYSQCVGGVLVWVVFCSELCNLGIFRVLSYSEQEEYLKFCQVSMMQHFFKEPCITVAHLEPWYIQSLKHIQNPVSIYNAASIFRTLVYFESMVYSEPCPEGPKGRASRGTEYPLCNEVRNEVLHTVSETW